MRRWLLLFFVAAAGVFVWEAWQEAVLRHYRIIGGNAAAYAETAGVLSTLRGKNLLLLNLSAWREKIEKLPTVAEARLRRRLPDTLEVELVTRRPLAVWGDGGLVDEQGRRYVGKAEERLPIFTGPVGRAASMADFYRRANALLLPLEERIMQLQVDENGAWRVFLEDGLVLYLGRSTRDERIRRYVRHAAPLRQRFAALKAVDLRYELGFSIIIDEVVEEGI